MSIDTQQWQASIRKSMNDGRNGTVNIVHAPNHTGFKGTEFVVHAVETLKAEGLDINFILLQKVQNDEVRRIFHEEADILVDQLICTGHGLNAVEGMASALPVICNLEDENYTKLFRRWSYFDECPIVSASPETITDTLRHLVTRPDLRAALGKAGRDYAVKYCGYDSTVYLFSHVMKYIYGEVDSIINLYHPLMSDYSKRLPPVIVPLTNNKIVP